MVNDITLRWAKARDYNSLGEVMFDAVRNGKSEYSEMQKQAWVPKPKKGKEWISRLEKQDIIIAENTEEIVGFMSLAPEGYLDLVFIRPDFQGQGLFNRLYERIEQLAYKQKHERIWVHASIMARSAFNKAGFEIQKIESVLVGQESLDRFEMEKWLSK